MSTFEFYYRKYVETPDDTNWREECEKVVQSIFNALPDVGFIAITGWTPSFNDGDPCTHSQTVSVGPLGDDEMLAGLLSEQIGRAHV